jgi:hypothetical protein
LCATTLVPTGAGIGIGYAIWHNHSIQPIHTIGTLDIQGMRDIPVPFKNDFKYTCTDGTLSVDGILPDNFIFENDTLTYTSDSLANVGTLKLKATAKDGSGRTNSITITYYPVTEIGINYFALLLLGGKVEEKQLTTTAQTVSLSLTSDEQKLVKGVYFGEMQSFSSIGDNFLSNCYHLTSVDIPHRFVSVNSIGKNFLFDCVSLAAIDLSTFTNVTSIGDNFLANCSTLADVTIGNKDFSNVSLGSLPMSNVTNQPSNRIYGRTKELAEKFKTKIGTVISE